MRTLRLPIRYAGWMARDAALGFGLAFVAIAALFSFLSRLGVASATAASSLETLRQVVGQFSWILVLIATSGVVSTEVSKGYYRALFAEPVSPAGYFLQRWLINAVAVAAFVPLTGLGLLVAGGFFPFSGPLLARLLLLYVMLGGLVFLLSTLLRTDWLIALLLYILQTVLHALTAQGAKLSPLVTGVALGLPPFHLGSVASMTYPGSGDLIHALGYGLGMVLLAVVVLSTRPLGSGGRA